MVDAIMGLLIFLFILTGTAGLIWFAFKGVNRLVHAYLVWEAKLVIDATYEAMRADPTLFTIHRYGKACRRYYVLKYGATGDV